MTNCVTKIPCTIEPTQVWLNRMYPRQSLIVVMKVSEYYDRLVKEGYHPVIMRPQLANGLVIRVEWSEGEVMIKSTDDDTKVLCRKYLGHSEYSPEIGMRQISPSELIGLMTTL